jgi:mycothiol synthase
MQLQFLPPDRLRDYIDYCKKHRKELDDSYLCDEDLDSFVPGEQHPTYIVMKEDNQIIAAASLLLDEYWTGLKKAKLVILHSEIPDVEIYGLLLDALKKHTEGFNGIYVFVPLKETATLEIFKTIGFTTERYAFLLVYDHPDFQHNDMPQGYEIRPMRRGMNEQAWCDVRNAAFAALKGSETPLSVEMLEFIIKDTDYLEGGLMILYHGDKPVGVVRGADDEYNGHRVMNVGAVGIIPTYQGKGLGRYLLRAALNFAYEKSYDQAVLSVNADNERAKSLYLREGFVQAEGFAEFRYPLNG